MSIQDLVDRFLSSFRRVIMRFIEGAMSRLGFKWIIWERTGVPCVWVRGRVLQLHISHTHLPLKRSRVES